MKKKVLVLVFMMFFMIGSFTVPKKAEAALADGTYSINYTVLQGDSDSVSMANDYFNKPATLVVSGGKQSVELSVNHSAWITGLWVDSGNGLQAEEISQNDPAQDVRTSRFAVSDLSSPVAAKIKVDIDNESLTYHHDYKITLQFAMDSAVLVASPANSNPEVATNEAGTTALADGVNPSKETTKVANPKSGDTTSITLYAGLFAVALLSLVLVRKTKKVH